MRNSRKGTLKTLLVMLCLLIFHSSCNETPTESLPTVTPQPAINPPRPFHLGFTPFPHDISQEAVDFAYDQIATDADLIAIHMDNGIPWPEAVANTAFAAHIMTQWNKDRSHIPTGHKLYVAVTPLNFGRDGLALYRAEQDDMPLPTTWAQYALNAPEVKQAYLNYVRRVIDYFEPDYLNIGIEVNLLMKNSPEKWPAYLELHQFVYDEVKSQFPNLPIMVSLTAPELLDDFTDADHAAQMQALQDILPYTDYFALSLYPFMGAFLTEYPPTMWDDLWALTPDKPIAIAEGGFIAEDLHLPSYGLHFEADEAKQAAYIRDLLAQAETHQFVFVINFILRDYDALWQKIGSQELFAVWRDTGLYDQDGNPRAGLEPWQAALARPHEQ